MYNHHMKPITFNVSEPLYELYRETARRTDRTTAELIREAMAVYAHDRLLAPDPLDSWRPLSLGVIQRDWVDGSFRDDMIDDRY